MKRCEYEEEITEIIDSALHKLEPNNFKLLLDNIKMIIEDYEDDMPEK